MSPLDTGTDRQRRQGNQKRTERPASHDRPPPVLCQPLISVAKHHLAERDTDRPVYPVCRPSLLRCWEDCGRVLDLERDRLRLPAAVVGIVPVICCNAVPFGRP